MARTTTSSVAEGLGYLGGIMALGGLIVLLSRVWDDLGAGGRIGLAAGVSVVMFVAGWLVPEERNPALGRLRGFLWLLSTAATGLLAGVVAVDVFDAEDGLVIAAAAAGAVLVHAGFTWSGRPRPLQQAPFLAAIAVVVGTLTGQVTSLGMAGLMVWAVGVAVASVGAWQGTSLPVVTQAVGAATLLIGTAIVSADWLAFGQVLATVSALTLMSVAAFNEVLPTRLERRVMATIALVGLLQAVPSTIVYFSREAGVLTGLVVWLLGVALVLAGTVQRVRLAVVVTVVGGAAIVGGAALCARQSVGFATLFGLMTAVLLVALGTMPRWALLSVFGSLGLLVNVPWAINHFFPGEGRAPVLIMVSGAVIVGVALLIARRGGRIRRELTAS